MLQATSVSALIYRQAWPIMPGRGDLCFFCPGIPDCSVDCRAADVAGPLFARFLRCAMSSRSAIGSVSYPDITVRVPVQYYKTWPKSEVPVSASGLTQGCRRLCSRLLCAEEQQADRNRHRLRLSVRDRYQKTGARSLPPNTHTKDVNRRPPHFREALSAVLAGGTV